MMKKIILGCILFFIVITNLTAQLQDQKSKPDFSVRGLEIHSSRMWRWQSVENAFDLMQKVGMNALIFHQVDLLDQLVLPRAYFSEDLMWKRWPVRLHQTENHQQYIRTVVREGKKRNINFFIEIKEIGFSYGLIELHPELIKSNGAICATDPFWWEYVKNKVEELLDEIPDIGGIIVSPASRESKVSIVANACTCERCKNYSHSDWYKNLFKAMYEPLHAKGKLLIVRDFAYTAAQQNIAIDAAAAVSKDIVIAMKNTPHDYYPTFPNNPRIGTVGNQPTWIEFDTWGQFYGMGTFPCSVVEDMQQRLDYCYKNKAQGAWFRTDWEGMLESSTFNSLNILNTIAGGILSVDHKKNLDEVYKAWADYGLLNPLRSESVQNKPIPFDSESLNMLKKFMRASWSVIEKTVFVRGHVFGEDGMFPNTISHAFDRMIRVHGRDDWEPGASKRVEPTEENIKIIMAEKNEAIKEAVNLRSILNVEKLNLPDQLRNDLNTMLDIYVQYVTGFSHCADVCFKTEKATSTKLSSDIQEAYTAIDRMISYRNELEKKLENTSFPHYVYWFLDVNRLTQLAEDAKQILSGIKNR